MFKKFQKLKFSPFSEIVIVRTKRPKNSEYIKTDENFWVAHIVSKHTSQFKCSKISKFKKSQNFRKFKKHSKTLKFTLISETVKR